MASQPAGTVERWWEYYKLEPWGDDHERSSMIAAQVSNIIQALAAGFAGGNADVSEIPLDAFVPFRKHKDEKAEQFRESLKALEGLRGLD